jgi:hypothetical protein
MQGGGDAVPKLGSAYVGRHAARIAGLPRLSPPPSSDLGARRRSKVGSLAAHVAIATSPLRWRGALAAGSECDRLANQARVTARVADGA